jgi:23S rRNA pseudouridine2605 synthase
MEERLQKILARMGVASRRKAEDLIREGKVTVNGRPAVIGMSADLSRDHIKLNGKLLTRTEAKVYFAFHKPRGVVTSLTDPEGRTTVKDFFRAVRCRVFPVGRLDYDSEGLLVVTNDGDLAQALIHPSKGIPKTYLVKVRGIVTEGQTERLRRGLRLVDGMTAPAKVKVVRQTEQNSWIEITITEGRNRQVRRMLEAIGHPVVRLRRVGIDGLLLGDLKPGEYRPIGPDELERIRRECTAV